MQKHKRIIKKLIESENNYAFTRHLNSLEDHTKKYSDRVLKTLSYFSNNKLELFEMSDMLENYKKDYDIWFDNIMTQLRGHINNEK